MMTRVVGLGQRYGGDDAWGLLVIDELERRALPGASFERAQDPSVLIDILQQDGPLIVVDAIATQDAHWGHLLEFTPSQLDPAANNTTSSHGLGVVQALQLGQVLHGAEIDSRVRIVALGICPPNGISPQPSEAVLARVGPGADRVEQLLRGAHA